MPRNNGPPTNRELQVRFTAGARDVFVAATERTFQGKVSEFQPWALDKPLDHLQLFVRKRHRTIQRHARVDTIAEKMLITPLQAGSAQELFDDDNESERYIIEYYAKIARRLARTVITDSLHFGVLSSSMVEAAWSVSHDPGEHSRGRVSSFMKEPLQRDLVRANDFTEEAVEYARHSDLFDKSVAVRLDERNLGISDVDPRYAMTHEFLFNPTPRLPINGREPRKFIENYVAVMSEGIARCEAELRLQLTQNASVEFLDILAQTLDDYIRAKQAAEKFL